MNNMKERHVTPKKVLSVFSLVMINVIAVDSLRTIPMGAKFGFALIFYYFFAALFFFIPTAFVTAELATSWPQRGGLYIWVREAFGVRLGLLVIWLQWIYNIVWFPAILSFVTGTLAFIIEPALVENKYFMLSVILLFFWGATFINFFGMRASSLVSTLGSLFGTLFPMLLIIFLGGLWIWRGQPTQIYFNVDALIPDSYALKEVVYLTAIVYGLVGLEMSSVHAGEVFHPERDYPKALLISVLIILLSLVLTSLAVAVVIPKTELNLVVGLIQAFSVFFDDFGLQAWVKWIAVAMILGGLASVATWIIGPTKGLLVASEDGLLPKIFEHTNEKAVPTTILIWQAIIVTLLCTVFLVIPTVSGAYWFLTALAAQLSLIMYAIMFVSAIRLRYCHVDHVRPFRIPGKNYGIWMIAGSGCILSLVVVGIGFMPPSDINVGNIYLYDTFLVLGIVIFCLPPFFLKRGCD